MVCCFQAMLQLVQLVPSSEGPLLQNTLTRSLLCGVNLSMLALPARRHDRITYDCGQQCHVIRGEAACYNPSKIEGGLCYCYNPSIIGAGLVHTEE